LRYGLRDQHVEPVEGFGLVRAVGGGVGRVVGLAQDGVGVGCGGGGWAQDVGRGLVR
jgi:hypothetical protein